MSPLYDSLSEQLVIDPLLLAEDAARYPAKFVKDHLKFEAQTSESNNFYNSKNDTTVGYTQNPPAQMDSQLLQYSYGRDMEPVSSSSTPLSVSDGPFPSANPTSFQGFVDDAHLSHSECLSNLEDLKSSTLPSPRLFPGPEQNSAVNYHLLSPFPTIPHTFIENSPLLPVESFTDPGQLQSSIIQNPGHSPLTQPNKRRARASKGQITQPNTPKRVRNRDSDRQKRFRTKLDAVNGVVIPSKLLPGQAPVTIPSHSQGKYPLNRFCPVCGGTFASIGHVRSHFVNCVKRNGNPQGLRYDDKAHGQLPES